jgi:hypothetical protein
MSSLAFDVLDTKVIHGKGDHVAWRDGHTEVTYARLLHESACIATGLAHMGVAEGDPICLDVEHSPHLVTLVMAVARVGAVVSQQADVVVNGHPPVLTAPSGQASWEQLDQVGRTDPLPAPFHDAAGVADALMGQFGHIVDALRAGQTIVFDS